MPTDFRERLIIFTRYSEPGKTKTRLIPVLGELGAAELQRRMTEHVISKVRKIAELRPISIEIHYEGDDENRMRDWLGPAYAYHSQPEGDIGCRMGRALDDAFQSGAETAVIIGTDIPDITSDILEHAFGSLKNNDLVLGPARDGGYYLIGMQSKASPKANPQIFSGISWGSDKVLSQTLQIVKKLGLGFILLETLNDVDCPQDLHVWERMVRLPEKAADRHAISIIIPTLNEADTISPILSGLKNRHDVEVIVVDGGSKDGTVELAGSLGARVLRSKPSKAGQMNAGAAAATGKVLLFLHSDTQLPEKFEEPILRMVNQNGIAAGAFQLHIESEIKGLRVIEQVANWRSRLLQAPYGDQGIFVTKALFDQIGGFPDIPIMEDFELIRRLKKKGKIGILAESVKTSPRRWLNYGIFKTWLINQIIIGAYYIGVPPEQLARWYRREEGRSSG